MSDEKSCMTCQYLKTYEKDEPCKSCFAWNNWEEMEPKTAADVIYDWERRVFDGNKAEC